MAMGKSLFYRFIKILIQNKQFITNFFETPLDIGFQSDKPIEWE